ncbi:MAG: cytochrome c, partial [Verrucomicrobiota bacterium]
SKAQLEQGYAVFLQNCVQCHEPRIPVDPEAESWHPIMRGMSWNANMKPAEEEAMIDYVRAAASEKG